MDAASGDGWPGGKAAGGVYHAIINQMPPHDWYVEPFVGGGGVLRYKRPAAWSICLDADPEAVERHSWRPGVSAVCYDGIRFLTALGDFLWSVGPLAPRVCVYCDPPYLPSTRVSGRIYRAELSARRHGELLEVVRALPCDVLISGYDSPLYRKALAGWRVVTYQAWTRGGFAANEFLWCNFKRPAALHDYSYIGQNKRERETFARRRRSLKRKLERISEFERRALWQELGWTVLSDD